MKFSLKTDFPDRRRPTRQAAKVAAATISGASISLIGREKRFRRHSRGKMARFTFQEINYIYSIIRLENT